MIAPTLKSRIHLCAALAALAPLAIAGRLFWLQTFRHEKLSATASKEFQRTVSEIGPRGRVFGAGGELLAESIITWEAGLFKKDLQEPARAVSELTRVLKLPPSWRKKYKRNKNFVPVKKGLDRKAYEAVKALKLKGVTLEPVQSRYYPSGDLARNIIGVTRADKGLAGIELLYDKVLSGHVSKREVIRDAGGRIIFEDRKEKVALPRDIHLTIDKNIQYFAQEAVRRAVEKNRAELGMALVQEPGSGRILAMATWPSDLEKIQPVEWTYEPGSTFKAITLAAALEKDVVKESDYFYCENGAWAFTPRIILHDHEPDKMLSLSGVIERSSNIGTAKIGLKLGLKDFYLYTKAFGFGAKSGLGFYGESAGLLRPLDRFKPIDLAVGSYGHGIAATPLQVLNAYSALANGGRLYAPRLVGKVTESDGEEVFVNEPTVIRQAVSPETSERVKRILRAVVEKGTGKPAAVPGYAIAGKTGTSKKIDPKTGKYLTGKNVASFAGFFPVADPKYTILVVIDNPKGLTYGGETAAPAFREIAAKIINHKGLKSDAPMPKNSGRQPAPRITD
ncbi:MAG: penicillin-binding protein [Elusimicrobia bacterium HGW-Elusimicrobia-3]|nr:MAG: penicillin-binding protein [Elusimicrobia bacterium HGW-Elusimicrobia-3]